MRVMRVLECDKCGHDAQHTFKVLLLCYASVFMPLAKTRRGTLSLRETPQKKMETVHYYIQED